MDPRPDILVTTAALADELAGPAPPALLHVRPGAAPPGAPRIPGAVDVDLARELAGPGGGVAGSRPLPSIGQLQADARRWGLRQRQAVVLYDDDRLLTAARGWWLLRWAGIARVRLLDGALPAWRAAGFDLATAPAILPPGDVALSPGHLPVLDADQAASLAREGRLLDSRVRVNYIGKGHIPGAVSAPAPDTLTEEGPFADAAVLAALFGALGADGSRPLGVSCGAGVSAAHAIAALALTGVPAALHVGSFSAWSADPARPVVRGADPG